MSGYAKTEDIPEALPNPQPLTFTGAVEGTYDGSAPMTVEIPQGGSGKWNGKLRLIAQVTIDQENIPNSIEIDQDTEGNPISLRKIVVYSDVQSTVSYTSFVINNAPWVYSLDMAHGKGWSYAEFGDDIMSSDTPKRVTLVPGCKCLLGGGIAEARYFGPATSIKFGSQYELAKGTFLYLWEVLD